MRILILSQYWLPENGVPQRRWAWLAGLLVQAEHEVTVVAPPPHYERQIGWRDWWRQRGFSPSPQVEVGQQGENIIRTGYVPSGHSIPQKVLNQIGVATGALRVIKDRKRFEGSFRPDLIIGTVPALPTAFITWRAARRFSVPYLIDLRDAWPQLLDNARTWNDAQRSSPLSHNPALGFIQRLLLMPVKMVLRWIYARSDGMMVTSDRLAQVMRRDMRYCKRQSIFTVRNVFPSESNSPKRNPSPAGTLNVLYAGTLGRAQRLDNALYAAKWASQKGVDINLVFIGSGVARQRLRQTARELGLKVRFESRRNASELSELYAWADTALVHLTDWAPLEMTVPSKTYELMQLGLHITGVVSGETAELIESLDAGHTVPPSNPERLGELWVELANNKEKLTVGGKARQWVEDQRERVAPRALSDAIDAASGCTDRREA